MKEIKRLRTIDQAYRELKAMDPDTAISKHYIRSIVLTGQLPHLQVESKRLIYLDDLMTYIEKSMTGITAKQS